MGEIEYKPEIHNLASFNYKLSDEFREYARYLKLSYLNERRLIEKEEIPELENLIKNNKYAFEVEKARLQLKSGDMTEEEYFEVYSSMKKKLMDAIVKANEEREVEQEESLKEEDLELPEDLYNYSRFLKLSIYKKQGLLFPVEEEELEEIIRTNEYVKNLLEAKRQLELGKLSLDKFNALKDEYNRRLMEANKIVTERRRKLNELPKKEETKEEKPKEITEEDELNKLEQDILDYGNEKKPDTIDNNNNRDINPIKRDPLVDFIYKTFNEDNKHDAENETSQDNEKGKEKEIKELVRYFNLRKKKSEGLTPEEQKEYDEIICNNDRAFEVEKADLAYKYNRISREEYDEIVNRHKDSLIEALSDFEITKKVEKVEKVEEEVTENKNAEEEVEKQVEEHHEKDTKVPTDEQPAKEDNDDMLKLMRETVDHYMAYKKGLNKIGVADMNGLLELLATNNKKEPNEGPTLVRK